MVPWSLVRRGLLDSIQTIARRPGNYQRLVGKKITLALVAQISGARRALVSDRRVVPPTAVVSNHTGSGG